jgi:hypothetical protein
MKTITDFVVDSAKDELLGKEVQEKLASGDVKSLHSWFQSKGYDVPFSECQKMVDNKNDLNMDRVGIW